MMPKPLPIQFQATDLETLASQKGRIAVLADADQPASPGFKRLDRLTKGALARAAASEAFGKLKLIVRTFASIWDKISACQPHWSEIVKLVMFGGPII